MVGPRGALPWFLRGVFLFGLLAALSLTAPKAAIARPYDALDGSSSSGDPTADDQPSPTPKPKAASVRITSATQGANQNATLGRSYIVTIRVPWDVYLRLLARTWVW